MLLCGLLLFFSGIARAYCSIDEVPAVGRAAAYAASVADWLHSHNVEVTDACPGLPNPDKEDAKPRAQWDGSVGALTSWGHPYPPQPRVFALGVRPAPIAEPVFRRFPRLLN